MTTSGPFQELSVNCRHLLLSQSSGVLSTHCAEVVGYPFGSIVPYIVGEDGQVIVFVSEAARHTENFQKNPKVSLTVVEGFAGNIQNYKRLTYMGKAVKISTPDPAMVDRFFRYFPSLAGFKKAKGTGFYTLELTTVRYIGGFDQVGWLLPEDFLVKNPFIGETEKRITKSLNSGSKMPLVNYCAYYKFFKVSNKQTLAIAGVDTEGFDIMCGDLKFRISFPHVVETPKQLNKLMKDMAIEALKKLDKQKQKEK